MSSSNFSSPGPSSSSSVDLIALHNQAALPKPFKSVPSYSSASTGRKRGYKQIIALEQERAFELGGIPTGKRRGPKKTGVSAPTPRDVFEKDGKVLAGAAARQARRRDERIRRQEDERATETPGETSRDKTTSPSPEDGDTTMLDEEELEQQRVNEVERVRKMNLPTYLSIEAPPSLRPGKKYCDITGLSAPYTDPKTQLRYHSAEIYDIIKTFGPGVDQAYLAIRGRGTALM